MQNVSLFDKDARKQIPQHVLFAKRFWLIQIVGWWLVMTRGHEDVPRPITHPVHTQWLLVFHLLSDSLRFILVCLGLSVLEQQALNTVVVVHGRSSHVEDTERGNLIVSFGCVQGIRDGDGAGCGTGL